MLLIYPPAARSTEPPLGIARLAAFVRTSGGDAQCLDLCREGIDYLLELEVEVEAEDNWTRGALRRRASSAETLRDPSAYRSPDRYGRAVRDLGRVLRVASMPSGAESSLADYRDVRRSPLRRADLVDAAMKFEENIFFPLFERRLSAAAPRDGWIGISICYLSQALCAFALIGYLKSTRPGTKIVIGGGLVTSWVAGGRLDPDESFGGLVDAVIAGPGEEALAGLLGLEGKIARDALDLSDFSELRYSAPTKILPYNFSFGCPWKRCTFCPEKAEGLPYRGIAAPLAVSQLERLGQSYAPGLIHFTDNEISPLYLRALTAAPPPAPWYGFARFSGLLTDPRFCASLSASGCVMLQLGLESGDQELLDKLGKGTRVEEIAIILENLAAVSIGTYIYVLFGTPTEDRDAAMRTRDFVAAHAGGIDFLNVAVFNLPASSVEARGLETEEFYEGELSLYSRFRHPSGWNRNRVRDFLREDFEATPEIRGIVAKTPPVFTSNHAPFFLGPR